MSLRLKMILGIGAILASVILIYTLIALRSQAKYRQDLARHQANLIAAMADRSLARAMGFGETEVIQAIRARIGVEHFTPVDHRHHRRDDFPSGPVSQPQSVAHLGSYKFGLRKSWTMVFPS